MLSNPICHIKLVWIVLWASLLCNALARVATMAVAVSAEPSLTASKPFSSTANFVPTTLSATTFSTVSPASTTMGLVQPCGSRGMRPCPQGLQCNYGKQAKLGFVQDLAGQCGPLDELL